MKWLSNQINEEDEIKKKAQADLLAHVSLRGGVKRGQLNIVIVLGSHLIQNLFERMKLASFRVHIVLVNLNSQKTLMCSVPPTKDKRWPFREPDLNGRNSGDTESFKALRKHKVFLLRNGYRSEYILSPTATLNPLAFGRTGSFFV